MSLKLRVGGRLREIRKSRGLTQERLAERIERSVDAVSALERGLALPSFETLEKLAEALDVPIRDFFDLEDGASEHRTHMLTRLLMNARALGDADLEIAVEQVALLARRGGK
ncbi:helix-turn-helix transcriptional regulator [Phenylobacterium sp.]|uniref:helix-turn-helix domain-containing protein n=1 Tax=Phenylobacterium sp. TaxID=1871053 RepID=UPI0030F41FAB